MLSCPERIRRSADVRKPVSHPAPPGPILLGHDMTLTAEQILASHKANIETLFGLTSKAFEGVEKEGKDLLPLKASLFQPLAEKTAAYSRHLYDIASGTGAEFGKAFETQASDAQKA